MAFLFSADEVSRAQGAWPSRGGGSGSDSRRHFTPNRWYDSSVSERIFEKIAPELNGGIPAGPACHRELVESMTLDLPNIRPPVISPSTARALAEFLRFRHLFRNLYGFELEWPRLRALLARLPDAWRALESDLRTFLEFLDAAARSS